MNVDRCLSILRSIRDYMYAIHTELISEYQDGEYLLSKLEPVIHDANVLKSEFEYLQKQQKLERSGENGLQEHNT